MRNRLCSLGLIHLSYDLNYADSENVHTYPQRVNGNSKGEGVGKANIFKEKYGESMEIGISRGVGRFNSKKLSVGKVCIFS